MRKRIILCSAVFCLLLTLPCCKRAKDPLDAMYSVSNAFLNVHYGVSVNQAEEYAQFKAELENGLARTPDAANERLKTLIKQKYQTQPLTEKGLESIFLAATPQTLWDVALSKDTDIKITSVEPSLRNSDIDDMRNDIEYTVNVLINDTSYKINGVLVLVLVDGKWLIDRVSESGWSPRLPN